MNERTIGTHTNGNGSSNIDKAMSTIIEELSRQSELKAAQQTLQHDVDKKNRLLDELDPSRVQKREEEKARVAEDISRANFRANKAQKTLEVVGLVLTYAVPVIALVCFAKGVSAGEEIGRNAPIPKMKALKALFTWGNDDE